jgi:hypothetical protein
MIKRFIPVFLKHGVSRLAQEADLRRNDNAAFMAASAVDKGVEIAGALVFWLRMCAFLFVVLICVGIANLFV